MITATSVEIATSGTYTFTLQPPVIIEGGNLTPIVGFGEPTATTETEPQSCFKVDVEADPCFQVRYDENPCFTDGYYSEKDLWIIGDEPYSWGMKSAIPNEVDLTDLDEDIQRIYGVWHDPNDIFGGTYAVTQHNAGGSAYWRLIKFQYDAFFGFTSGYQILDFGTHETQNIIGNKYNFCTEVLYSSTTIQVMERDPYDFISNISNYSYANIGFWDDDYMLPSNISYYQVGTVNGTQHCGSGFTGQPIYKQRVLRTFGGTVDLIESDIYARSEYGFGVIHKQGEWFVFAGGGVAKNPSVGYFSIGLNCYYGWRNAEQNFNIGESMGDIQISDEILMRRRYDANGANAPYCHPIDFYDLETGLLIATSESMSDATLVGGRMVMYAQFQGDVILRIVDVDTL